MAVYKRSKTSYERKLQLPRYWNWTTSGGESSHELVQLFVKSSRGGFRSVFQISLPLTAREHHCFKGQA